MVWVNVEHISMRIAQNIMGRKGDPGLTPETCGTVDERAQMILMRVRVPGVGNACHPQRLGVTRVRP